jgi:nicotinate-nucleotide pyrophosphorylase
VCSRHSKSAKRYAEHLVKIELEVDTLDQLAEALEVGVDFLRLDYPQCPDPRSGPRYRIDD